MSGSIFLHRKHGVAPALTFCRICGKEAQELALLGSKADTVMRQLYEDSHGALGDKDGYKEYGHNRIPAQEPCDECKAHLQAGGTIILAKDTGEYLKLDASQIDHLQGRVADAKGRLLNFKACAGKVLHMDKAFWVVDGDNIRLRDPKEWS